MSKPPKVRLNKSEPLQGWYCDREGNRYSVARRITWRPEPDRPAEKQ